MFRKLIRICMAFALFALLAGFGSGTPIYNATAVPIPQAQAPTLDGIEKAIVRAGLQLGWKIAPQGPGKAEGVLAIRTHTAIVDITYDTKSYSIVYKSSVNLSYDERTKTIHSNYNGWIRNLEKAINVQVSVL